MLEILYMWIGKLVIWLLLIYALYVILYGSVRYIIVLSQFIYLHVIKEVAVKDKWKKQKFWKLKLFFRLLFSFSFILDKIYFTGTISSEEYRIDYSNYIPKYTIYGKRVEK